MGKKTLLIIAVMLALGGCSSADQAFMHDWMEATVDELNKQ